VVDIIIDCFTSFGMKASFVFSSFLVRLILLDCSVILDFGLFPLICVTLGVPQTSWLQKPCPPHNTSPVTTCKRSQKVANQRPSASRILPPSSHGIAFGILWGNSVNCTTRLNFLHIIPPENMLDLKQYSLFTW
jgi:hypothetical protein